MTDLYLTPEELEEHTGLKQAAAQRRMLEADGLKKGVHFFVRADRKLRVLRAALLGRVSAQTKPAPSQATPNFDALPSLTVRSHGGSTQNKRH